MDQGRDEVRIMTAHAAKGLEAPVVFLVDGGGAAFQRAASAAAAAVRDRQDRLARHRLSVAFGRRRGQRRFRARLRRRVRERGEDEYRRLLYVGMTRAEDRLIVCGYHGKRAATSGTWHAIVSRGAARAAGDGRISASRYRPAGLTGSASRRCRPCSRSSGSCMPERVIAPLPPHFFDALPPEERPAGAAVAVARFGP